MFADARLKIARANKHIRDIEERISRLEESYSAAIEIHPKFGYKQIKYDLADKSAGKDISILAGDALHNLKCALDYAWLTILRQQAPVAITPKTQFPAYASRDVLEAALKKSRIDLSSPALFGLMLAKIKPFAGGNDAIWDVKQLNVLDKHRLLLPLIGYTSIVGLVMEDESGKPANGFASATMQPPPWYIRIPDGWRVVSNGKPSISILFDEGTPVHHLNAPSFLEMYSLMILQVIETLESF